MIVRMFKPLFARLVECGAKCQTVRPVPKRPPRVGDRISLRTWTGRPYRSKQKVLCESVVRRVAAFRIDESGSFYVDGRGLGRLARESFAQLDGFGNADDLFDWLRRLHGVPFDGIVIYWHEPKAK